MTTLHKQIQKLTDDFIRSIFQAVHQMQVGELLELRRLPPPKIHKALPPRKSTKPVLLLLPLTSKRATLSSHIVDGRERFFLTLNGKKDPECSSFRKREVLAWARKHGVKVLPEPAAGLLLRA